MKDFKFLRTKDYEFYGNLNDLNYDSNKDIEIIENSSRIKQDIVKILSTRIGENLIFDGYGSELKSLIGQNFIQTNIQTIIKNTILYAISYIDTLENSADSSERIKEIKNVQITRDKYDPRIVYIKLEIILQNNETLLIVLKEGD